MNFAMNIEHWALIDGYDNYEISSFGRVRNNETKKIMKSRYTKDGYFQIGLTKDKNQKTYFIHRLVGFAFLEKKDEDVEIDHIDHNRGNNMVNNLRWTTTSINGRNRLMSQRNTSGCQGVQFCKNKSSWIASWYEESQQTKSFSVNKYGEDQAKQMAIDYRRQMAQENGYLNV